MHNADNSKMSLSNRHDKYKVIHDVPAIFENFSFHLLDMKSFCLISKIGSVFYCSNITLLRIGYGSSVVRSPNLM